MDKDTELTDLAFPPSEPAGPKELRDKVLLPKIDRGSRTLWERLAAASHVVLPPPLETRLLASWARVVGGGSEPVLWRRLRWDGIETWRAAAALLPAGEGPDDGKVAPWTSDLLAYADRAARHRLKARPAGSGLQTPFAELWLPWVELGAEWLREEAGLDLDEFARPALVDLEAQLLAEVAQLSEVAAHELFDARRQAAGETVAELYRGFVADGLSDPLGNLYSAFPVLARQTVRSVRQWVERNAELARRLRSDRTELSAVFFHGQDPGPVESVQASLSDRHRGGRQVLRLAFRAGLDLVYKPRSLAAEAVFADFLDWCSRQGLAAAPPAARVLCREGYGWMAVVDPEPIADREAARAYYRSAGVLTALAYALRAEDLHAENLIATAAGPVVIDAENLLQPLRVRLTSGEDFDAEASESPSCLATGLLTQLLPGGREDRGMGGLRVAERRLVRRVWHELASDHIWVEMSEEACSALPNAPRLAGVAIGPETFVEEVCAGFTAAYRFLVAHRDPLLSEQGPLTPFRRVPIRVLFRSSQEYSRVLQLSALPRNQRSGLAGSWLQEALLAILVAAEVGNVSESGEEEGAPSFWPLAKEERTALEAGDVPWFGLPAEAVALPCTDGDPVAGLFAVSGLAAVHRRLTSLDEPDLARQLSLVRLSLTPLLSLGPPARTPLPRAGEEAGLGDRFKRAAMALGDEVVAAVSDDSLHLLPSLGHGPLGTALFVAALVRGEGGRRYEECLGRLVLAVEHLLRAGGPALQGLSAGGFSGLGSGVWGLVWLSRLTAEPRLLGQAEALARHLDEPYGREFDLDRGAAGAILGLLCLAGATGAAVPVKAALRWGEVLLAGQTVSGSAGAGWRNPAGLVQTGWTHGTAGVARSLAALAEATGEPRFLVATAAAIGHERQLFDPVRRNWPVLLTDETGRRRWRRWMVACCRGAPGVALARLYLPPALQDATLAAERELALDTTAEAPFSELDHLCCGNLGRSSVLLSAALRTRQERWREAAERLALASLDRAAATGRLMLAEGYDNLCSRPGFLHGAAGAGYQFLRLAGTVLPDILALELPGEQVLEGDG